MKILGKILLIILIAAVVFGAVAVCLIRFNVSSDPPDEKLQTDVPGETEEPDETDPSTTVCKNHNRSESLYDEVVIADCTREGIIEYCCDECGEVYEVVTYPPLGHTFEDCGVCESRCPYNLPIRKMLKRVNETFANYKK